MEKTEKYSYTADTFHCDFNHELCFGHLGNAMLNAADVHSTRRNFGMTYLNTIHKTWVLSRLAIELCDTPLEHNPLTIETWVENAMKYFTKRNWAITSADGTKTYGYGKSIWAMIDTETRSPQDILAIHDGKIRDYLYPEKECPIADVSRVMFPAHSEEVDEESFVVKYSDIDVNGHLNSMKYVDHVLDTFSTDHYKEYHLQRLEIAYVAEGHYGDTIIIQHVQEDDLNHSYRLVRRTDESDTELCRVKLTFIKR